LNIIRTKVEELSTIPAIAYKVKMASRGSGIKLHRTDQDAVAFAPLDKRTGEAKLDHRADASLFPIEALEEAVEILTGLPYSARGKVNIVISETPEENEMIACDSQERAEAEARVIESDEFTAITGMYSDTHGKMNTQLMNKQFIQFASSSKTVDSMIANKATEEEIIKFVLKNRAAYLAGKKESLSDIEIDVLIETLEDINTRGAFKELKLFLRRRMAWDLR